MLDLDLYGRYMTEMYQTYQLYQQTTKTTDPTSSTDIDIISFIPVPVCEEDDFLEISPTGVPELRRNGVSGAMTRRRARRGNGGNAVKYDLTTTPFTAEFGCSPHATRHPGHPVEEEEAIMLPPQRQPMAQ